MTARIWFMAAAMALGGTETGFGQKHEVGLTMGTLVSQTRVLSGGKVESGRGTALQANYGLRLIGGDRAALFLETHLLASPQRKVTSALGTASTDYASLYLTPGARIKFAPNARFSPWVAVGGGYAQYENSLLNTAGGPNTAPRHEHHGAFAFGGGVDVMAFRWLSLRGEIRNFYGPGPDYGVSGRPAKQHNVVVVGGVVLKLGK
jgi:opacity protein-like surface antigen